MRFRPLHAALGIVLVSAVGLPAAAASAPARHGALRDEIPLTVGKAYVRDMHAAVGLEQELLKEIPKVAPVKRDLAKSQAELAIVDAGLAKYDGTDAAEVALRRAEAEDKLALKEAKKTKPDWKLLRVDISMALPAKRIVITDINEDLVRPIPQPPAPAPTPIFGPLGACIFVTNNGSSSTETVKLTDPGAAGFPGSVNFNGQGLNLTSTFTVPANATVFVPFNVGIFGNSTITATVNPPGAAPQTKVFEFLLGESNDKTTTDCNTQ